MDYHSFSLDPRVVLGVGPSASLDQIREAYRVKSKKHHPDFGGDEWAFRMVAWAYEVLKATAPTPWAPPATGAGQNSQMPDWGRIWSPFSNSPGSTSGAQANSNEASKSGKRTSPGWGPAARPESISHPGPSSANVQDQLLTIDVELIWTRLEKERPRQLVSTQEGDDATLSVCMRISWPPHDVIDQAAQFPSTGETLRLLIELFENLRGKKAIIAARSRIEDGQFVGWLSYVDVLTAQDAFLAVRDKFRTRGLAVKLSTRDQRVPYDWYGSAPQSVMLHAS